MASTIAAALKVPFSASPDPTCLYVTSAIRQAIFKVGYTIDARQGLVAILGDFGLGKSTLLRYLYSKHSAIESNEATFLPTPSFRTSFSMLQRICSDFEIPPARSEMKQQDALEAFLAQKAEEGKNVVLFIDEAQRLRPDQLELVRTLLNFETNREKLIQIVVAGQLELRKKLMSKKYRALASRVFAPVMMSPLEFDEMVEMLRVRCNLHQVAWPFNGDEPLQRLYAATKGVPRSILIAVQMAFALMPSVGRQAIDSSLIEIACNDLRILQEGGDGKE